MPAATTVKVTDEPLIHDRRERQPGDVFDTSAEHAALLVERGLVELVDDDAKPRPRRRSSAG